MSEQGTEKVALTDGERSMLMDNLADDPMWIGADGEPLDYLPEREALIGDHLDRQAATVGRIVAARLASVEAHLTPLAPDLWLDLSEIVSVRTYTAQGSYSRVVVLLTRWGVEHKVTVPGTSGGSKPVSVGDRLLAEWLAENLAPVLFPPGELS